MLFPVDNEARQMKELNGIWKFKRDNYYKQGFEEKWFEKPLEDVIDMPVPDVYKRQDNYHGKNLDWPDYGKNEYGEAATRHVRYEYASLMSMCDHYLGKVLDMMDKYDLWKDTMLIVNTCLLYTSRCV